MIRETHHGTEGVKMDPIHSFVGIQTCFRLMRRAGGVFFFFFMLLFKHIPGILHAFCHHSYGLVATDETNHTFLSFLFSTLQLRKL